MFKRQDQYAAKVKSLYDLAIDRLISLSQQVPADITGKPFSFADNPRLANETSMILRQLYSQVYSAIKDGVEAEWELANLSADKMIGSIFGFNLKDRNLCARWFDRNQKAMDAFFARKSQHGGLNLSQRVWKYTSSLRPEMEMAIQVSMGEGVPAGTMSRRIRKYLREPDKLFRRVRDAKGDLRLSAAAKAYHPGRGVYRSSYKNAMRLARTETNAAYRTADEERWKNLDFVIGYEVKLSNNHTTHLPNGKVVPLTDICDDLKGKYPKTFKFTSWHPQCRCYVVPILAKPDEMIDMQKAILEGKDPRTVPVSGKIDHVPDQFTGWVSENADRIRAAKVKPYFIQDNYKYGNIDKGLKEYKKSVQEIAVERHARQDRVSIQNEWNQRKYDQAIARIRENDIIVGDALSARLSDLESAVKSGNIEAIQKAQAKVMKGIDTQIKWDKLVWNGITPEQKAEMRKLESLLGIRKGRPMTHELADTGLANPKYQKRYIKDKDGNWISNPKYDKQYSINCQTCVPTYMLRRWGFNVEALGNIEGDAVRDVWKHLSHNYTNVWINSKGEVGYGRRFRTFESRGKLFSTMAAQEDGIYQVECTWKGGNSAHTFVFVKEKGTAFVYDPQTNVVFKTAKEFKEYSDSMSVKWKPEFFRIDNLRPNSDALQHIVKEAEKRRNRQAEIMEIARKRHEARDVDALNKRIEERRKRHAMIQKQANSVLKVAKGYMEIDSSKMVELMNDYKLPQLEQETKRIAKQIAGVNKKIDSFSDLIPDGRKYLSTFTSDEIEGAYKAIQKTFGRWTWDLDTDSSLSFLKGRLEREIGIVKSSPHATRDIAREAFQRRLDLVERKIQIKSVKNDLQNEFKFVKTSRKKVLRDLADEVEAMLKDDSVSLADLRTKADELKKQVAKSMARRNARKAAKGVKVAVSGSMTDAEIVDEMTKLFASKGYSLDAKDIVIKDGCVYLNASQHKILSEICKITASEKKQTWSHASGGYVQTGNSFKINGALRDVEGKGAHAMKGPDIRSNPNVAIAKDMYGRGLDSDDILTIEALDKVLGDNTLPFPIKVIRNLDDNGIKPFFGGNVTSFTPKDMFDEINALVDKTMFPDCGYMSVSTNAANNVFKRRRFQLQIEVPQGTPIYVTSNLMESECILGRETKLIFDSVEYDSTNKVCIIKCVVQR